MIILQDNHEKLPWDFTIYKDVEEQRLVHLDTGDYTVLGHENSICIERKHSTNEISLNLGIKFKQFKNELIRMESYKHKHVICEFPEHYVLQFPKFSGIPPRKWKWLRMNGKFLYGRLVGVCGDFNINLHFCNNKSEAQDKAIEILRNAIR